VNDININNCPFPEGSIYERRTIEVISIASIELRFKSGQLCLAFKNLKSYTSLLITGNHHTFASNVEL